MKRLGLDVGTKHIVLAWKDADGKMCKKYEVNGYLTLPSTDMYTENLLKAQKIPYVKRGKEFVAFGMKAEQLAFTFNKTLQRPMASGGVSKIDDDAQEILAIIIRGIIGKLQEDAILYYCTTAQPINSDIFNVDFHQRLVKALIESYSGEAKIQAHHINEARCLIIEEPGEAVGISWGAGTVTVHAGIMGMPIFEFSIVGSGDWVDNEVAKTFGYDPSKPYVESRETPTTVCRRKEQINLLAESADQLDRAIVIMYDVLIDNVVSNLIRGFRENRSKFRFNKPITVVNAGGTAMPPGFLQKFTAKLSAAKDDLSIPIGDVKLAKDPLFAVAHGCAIAADLHQD